MTYIKIKIRVFGHAQWVKFAGGHKLSLVYLNGIIKSSSQNNPGTLCMIQTKLALISFIQQLRDDKNNLYQYLAYVYVSKLGTDAAFMYCCGLKHSETKIPS